MLWLGLDTGQWEKQIAEKGVFSHAIVTSLPNQSNQNFKHNQNF